MALQLGLLAHFLFTLTFIILLLMWIHCIFADVLITIQLKSRCISEVSSCPFPVLISYVIKLDFSCDETERPYNPSISLHLQTTKNRHGLRGLKLCLCSKRSWSLIRKWLEYINYCLKLYFYEKDNSIQLF